MSEPLEEMDALLAYNPGAELLYVEAPMLRHWRARLQEVEREREALRALVRKAYEGSLLRKDFDAMAYALDLVREMDDDSDDGAGCCCMCFERVGTPHKATCERSRSMHSTASSSADYEWEKRHQQLRDREVIQRARGMRDG